MSGQTDGHQSTGNSAFFLRNVLKSKIKTRFVNFTCYFSSTFRIMSQLNKLNLIKFLSIRPNVVFIARNCSKTAAKKDESEENEDSTPVVLVQDDVDDLKEREMRLKKIRNKSRLLPQHRNMLMETVPYPNGEESWIHTTVKYKRGLFGKYGLASGVDPSGFGNFIVLSSSRKLTNFISFEGICFPTASEQADKDEYERVAFPFTLQEMQRMNAELRKEKRDAIMKREEDVAKKLDKLEHWMNELNARIAKKEADARAARERKERLVEEVRRHFGYTVDVKDEKFKEMLAQKEKEDKKAQKEARKKQKEMKMLEKLINKGKAASDDVAKDGEPKTS